MAEEQAKISPREAVSIALERGKDAYLRMIGLAAADPSRFVVVAAPMTRERAGSRFAALAGLGAAAGSSGGSAGAGAWENAPPQDVALAAMCATSVYEAGGAEAMVRRMRRRLFSARMLSRNVDMGGLRDRERERDGDGVRGAR